MKLASGWWVTAAPGHARGTVVLVAQYDPNDAHHESGVATIAFTPGEAETFAATWTEARWRAEQ